MSLLVFVTVPSLFECTATNIASKGAFPCVCTYVRDKYILTSKFLSAFLTLMWPIVRMKQQMLSQAVSRTICLITLCTFERRFPCMYALMDNKVLSRQECLTTMLTRMGSLSSMHTMMRVQS